MALSRQDIIQYICLYSGQYIAGFDSTLIDNDQLDMMIKRELAFYSKHRPLVKTEAFTLYDNKSFSVENDGVVPTNIVKITTRKIANIFIPSLSANWGLINSSYWRYDNPVLRFSLPNDIYEVNYFINHEYLDNEAGELATLDLSDDKFLDLILARFMITVGRSRRSFRINDIPVEVDYTELVDEGKTLYDETVETIKDGNDFWLAII